MIMLGPVGACSYDKMNFTSTQENHQLEPGTWGGQNIRLDIIADSGTLDLSCAHGELSEPFKMDRPGHFEFAGHIRRKVMVQRDRRLNLVRLRPIIGGWS
jgi:hypothetical protein